MKSVFLADFLTTWSVSVSTVVRRGDFRGQRMHDILRHAEHILESHNDADYTADAIENINKALDQRFNLLSKVFSLKSLRRSELRSLSQTDALCRIGALRPLMIGEINSIRNKVNHEDDTPPNLTDSKRLAEFAWYVLKSTDALVQVDNIALLFRSSHDAVSTTVNLTDPWHVDCSAQLGPSRISLSPFTGNIRCNMDEESYLTIVDHDLGILPDPETGMISFSGTLALTPNQQLSLAKAIAGEAPLYG